MKRTSTAGRASRRGAAAGGLSQTALRRFLRRAQTAAGLRGQVGMLLADDAELRRLNRLFRGQDKTTDVLSFPAIANQQNAAGDLAISLQMAQRQAAAQGHALETEVQLLLLHGVLHLAGHDHESDNGEMRRLEEKLRAQLGLPVGLIARAATPRRRP